MSRAADPSAMVIPLAVGGLVALGCLTGSIFYGRRKRLLENLPTCKTTGVFIGEVELKGTAEAEQPLASFLAAQACVFFQWTAAEHWSRTVTETHRDSKGHTHTRTRHESGWKTVASGGEQIPFYLKDEAGVVLIQPVGAKIEPVTIFDQTCHRGDPLYYGKGPAAAVANSDHRRRFHETAIPLHALLYVMGRAREREDIVAPEIASDTRAEMFLISMRTEEQVTSGYQVGQWLCGVLGIVAAMAGVAVGQGMAGREPPGSAVATVAAGIGYVLVWLLTAAVMVYNSMVNLGQRVQQAWANVDVQLKRRTELIPNLVHVVEGLRDYECQLQIELAHLRNQLAATAPGEPGPDPQACRAALVAMIERYPELKADESFLNLQKHLVDTEERIALARSYFNEIATFYNTRLDIVPDRFLAALASMKPRALMRAEGFERAPVVVNLVD